MSRAIKVEHTFLILMLMRIAYTLYYFLWMFPKHNLIGKYRAAATATEAYDLYQERYAARESLQMQEAERRKLNKAICVGMGYFIKVGFWKAASV
jgi:hypothetical protein